jgi:hypothetical protein
MLRSTRHSLIADRSRNLSRPGIRPSLALPQVWRTDGGHRTTYCCSTPTPFSTNVGHYCGMKRLAHNSKPPHGSPRSAPVRPTPDTIPTPRPLSHFFRHRFSLPHARGPPPRLLCRLRQLQHPSFAPFNLHKARVRRASGFLLTAFSNARPNPLFCSTHLTTRRASEKVLA